jgi:glycosyltransferase involved in cell wall biosynthesis
VKPRVSIIIPCFNAEAWVGAAIDSVLAQTWPETEVIAINDGSRDASLAEMRRFEGPRVRVLDQGNLGASAARNSGLRAASGEFIQFLDADDLLAPDKIATQMDLLNRSGDRAVATARWGRFEGDPSTAKVSDCAMFQNLSPIDFLLLHTSDGLMMHPAAWLVPAELARDAGPWNETLSLNDDGEYFCRVVLASRAVVHAPDSLTLYRSGIPHSLSSRRDPRSLDSLYRSCVLVAARMREAEDSPRVRRALADYFQRLAYVVYPEAPGLSRLAQSESRALGGSSLKPSLGRKQALLARWVGWRLAKRVAAYFSR